MRIQTILIVTLIFTTAPCYINAELNEITALHFFSQDYTEARQKFLKASHELGAHVESFEHPLTGPEGEPIFTDVALIGAPDARTLLVVSSGLHGVEGFTGSAIQTGLLHEDLSSITNYDLSIIMIHALNPYGFAHLRRFNEDNVDINRNFIDHSRPYPSNPGYEKLAEATSPRSTSLWSDINALFRILSYRLKNGKVELKNAISGGQYTHPRGLFYGGHEESWTNRTIKIISERYLSAAEQVVFIDIHTGLGSYGNFEVILNEEESSPAFKRAVDIWGDLAKTTASGESLSGHLQSSLKLSLPRIQTEAEMTAVTLEFGTYSVFKVF